MIWIMSPAFGKAGGFSLSYYQMPAKDYLIILTKNRSVLKYNLVSFIVNDDEEY